MYMSYYDLPQGAKLLAYGIDFGYNDPSVLISVHKLNDSIYCKELLYLKNITIPDFIYKIKDLGINLTEYPLFFNSLYITSPKSPIVRLTPDKLNIPVTPKSASIANSYP